MTDRNYITVSELNYYLNRILDAEELLHNIYVLGEVSGISYHKGNLYCTIKDDDSQLSVVCFAADKTYMPEVGEEVLMYGTPTYYTKTGKLSFVVRRIEPFGKGKLHLELEALKKRLLEEGIFNDAHKTEAPKYTKNVCLVTSINGAVVHDIYSTIRKYNNLINVCIVNVSVQGKTAVEEIVKGLRLADKGGFDTVILARGGGSFEDLMPFNSEAVVRALYNMDTYVISAVGHETDVTLSDLAADARALTPTAAAEMIAFDTDRLIEDVISEIKIAGRKIEAQILKYSNKATELTRACTYKIGNKLNVIEQKINTNLTNIKQSVVKLCNDKENQLISSLNKLEILNPLNILKSGYLKGVSNDRIVSSVSDVKEGDTITLYAKDGKIVTEVIDIQ